MALPDENHIKFGSAMEGFLPIEKGEKAEVRTFVNEEDEAALIKSILRCPPPFRCRDCKSSHP